MPPRRRGPLRRAQIAPRKFAAKPDCMCGEPWRKHLPRCDGDERGYCNQADCSCTAYRPKAVR